MNADRGLLDAAAFASCRELAAHTGLFRRELALLPAERFVPYVEPNVYDGAWLICPLLLRWATVPAFLDPVPNQLLCVESHRLLAADPRILGAGYSRLLPGTRIMRHADLPLAGVLRFHLCLDGDADTALEVDGREVPLRAGHGFVFDNSLPHSARHDGVVPRDCLIVDFRPSAAEAAALRRSRGGINLGPTGGSLPDPGGDRL